MSSFQGFDGVGDVVNRLEDHVASIRYKVEPVILLENNERLKGLEYITPLHDAILLKEVIKITYKSFISEESQTFCFSPYLLKEFRNRWFVFGKRHDSPDKLILNLALDRIEYITDAPQKEKYKTEKAFQPQTYFKNRIGVTRDFDSPVEHVVCAVPRGGAAAQEVLVARKDRLGCVPDRRPVLMEREFVDDEVARKAASGARRCRENLDTANLALDAYLYLVLHFLEVHRVVGCLKADIFFRQFQELAYLDALQRKFRAVVL